MVVVLHQAQTSNNPKRRMPIGNPEMEPHLCGHFKGCNVLSSFYSQTCQIKTFITPSLLL